MLLHPFDSVIVEKLEFEPSLISAKDRIISGNYVCKLRELDSHIELLKESFRKSQCSLLQKLKSDSQDENTRLRRESADAFANELKQLNEHYETYIENIEKKCVFICAKILEKISMLSGNKEKLNSVVKVILSEHAPRPEAYLHLPVGSILPEDLLETVKHWTIVEDQLLKPTECRLKIEFGEVTASYDDYMAKLISDVLKVENLSDTYGEVDN